MGRRATGQAAPLELGYIEHSEPQLADCSNNLDITKRASRVNKGKKKHQLLIHLL